MVWNSPFETNYGGVDKLDRLIVIVDQDTLRATTFPTIQSRFHTAKAWQAASLGSYAVLCAGCNGSEGLKFGGDPASSVSSDLQVGTSLPELRGEYLSGRPAILPRDASGRVALLLFGFSRDSRFAVQDWTKRFRDEFGENPKATFFEVPMIGGFARLEKWFIERAMRRGTPTAEHENVITVYGGTDPWKRRLGFNGQESAYLIVLDRKGTVVWRHAGRFEELPYQALAAQVRKLLSEQ